MKYTRTVLVLICAACATGCNNEQSQPDNGLSNDSPQAMSSNDTDPEIEILLDRIRIGTQKSEVTNIIKPVALDSGIVFWGGTGARRMYFQIRTDKQIWFELSGPNDGNCVIEIGHIETKSEWIRHDDGSITVEEPMPDDAG